MGESSGELHRSLRLCRGEIKKYIEGRTQGYSMRLWIDEAINVSPAIFVVQRKTTAAGATDEFSHIASPADLEELPAGDPEADSPYFRVDEVTLVFRNRSLLTDTYNLIESDVRELLTTLGQMDQMVESCETVTGPYTPPTTRMAVRFVVANRAPTTDDDETQFFAVGSWWLDSENGDIYILSSNTAGEAIWLPVAATTDVPNNFNADREPLVTDDVTADWLVGSRWIKPGVDKVFTCVNNTEGAAIWVEAAIASADNKLNRNMPASTTAADGDIATVYAMAATPARGSHVLVTINGNLVPVGDGAKDQACFFSADGGSTAKPIASVASGDSLYWVGSVAGFQLSTVDVVDFYYRLNA